MSENVAYAGFCIKANDEDQNEESMILLAQKLGYEVESYENDLEDIIYSSGGDYLNKWKPSVDVNGTFGFIYQTHYEYGAYDIKYKQPISAIGKVLKEFIDKTMKMPENEINTFAIIYYNGSDSPFKF